MNLEAVVNASAHQVRCYLLIYMLSYVDRSWDQLKSFLARRPGPRSHNFTVYLHPLIVSWLIVQIGK